MAPVPVPAPVDDPPPADPTGTLSPPPPEPDPIPLEPPALGGTIHGLFFNLPSEIVETVRHSISSLTWRESRDESKTGNDNLKDDDVPAPVPVPVPVPCSAPHDPRPRHLLTLPPEVLLLVLQQLDLADIIRLRQTCKYLHALASPSQIRILLGPAQLRTELLSHCKTCLFHDPFRSRLLAPPLNAPSYPLASCCLDCALKARDPRIRVGKKIHLGNFSTVYACRYCGIPIVEGAAFGHEQFHRLCYKRYNDRLFFFFVLGWLQLSLGIVAAALAWKYYRNSILVFAPTVANFLLLWICLAFIILRGNRRRTYHYTLVLELAILALWIPPVYHIATGIAGRQDDPVLKSTQATLAMFALNMLFRLLNLLGNLVLLLRLDPTERHRKCAPSWQKPLYHLAAFLTMWTYPQSLEEKSRDSDCV